MTAWELVLKTLLDSGFEAGNNPEKRSFQIDFDLGFETSHYLDGFEHPDGRFHFRADWNQWPLVPVCTKMEAPIRVLESVQIMGGFKTQIEINLEASFFGVVSCFKPAV